MCNCEFVKGLTSLKKREPFLKRNVVPGEIDATLIRRASQLLILAI
jgi:hypothetical protein